MKVEVLYIAECPNHKPAVEQARAALRAVGVPAIVEEVEVRTNDDAQAWRFLGSPTVRVNGLDVEPEARGVEHFGVGCRSYQENGRRSGLPSRDLIQRALQEDAGVTTSPVQTGSQKKKGAESSVLVAGGLAAVLASTCCLGPLLLVALGFSGAWEDAAHRAHPTHSIIERRSVDCSAVGSAFSSSTPALLNARSNRPKALIVLSSAF